MTKTRLWATLACLALAAWALLVSAGCGSTIKTEYAYIDAFQDPNFPFRMALHAKYTANFNAHALKAEHIEEDLVSYLYLKRRVGAFREGDFAVGPGSDGPNLVIEVRGTVRVTDKAVLVDVKYKSDASMREFSRISGAFPLKQ